jgi:hypothetical protein
MTDLIHHHRNLEDPADRIHQIRVYLQQWFPEFNYSPRDDTFLAALHAEFPSIDLLEQLKAFHAWCLDKHNAEISYRLTFRKWLSRAKPARSQPPP